MAKIRLNEEKRHDLLALAYKKLGETPDDPALITRVEEAEKALTAAEEAVIDFGKKQLESFPKEHMRILRKYGLTSKSRSIKVISKVISKDNPYAMTIELFNRAKFERDHDYSKMSYEEQAKVRKEYSELEEEAKVEIPRCHVQTNGVHVAHVDDHLYFVDGEELKTLVCALRDAQNEYDIAQQTLDEKHRKLREDFEALIGTARYFEDVAEFWPEAKEIAHKMVPGTAVSLVSDDTKKRIAENMAMRGVSAS